MENIELKLNCRYLAERNSVTSHKDIIEFEVLEISQTSYKIFYNLSNCTVWTKKEDMFDKYDGVTILEKLKAK